MKGYVYSFEEEDSQNFGYYLNIKLEGCNLNCPFCPYSNIRTFNDTSLIDFYELKTSMKITDRTIITGGEPLLQEQFIIALKNIAKDYNKQLIVSTNLSRPNSLTKLISKGIQDYIVNWWSYDDTIFNRLTSAKTYFKSQKEVLYDIFISLHILRQNSISPWFKFTLIPGLFYTKDCIMNEIAFITNFGFLPQIILSPLKLENTKGRWRSLHPISDSHLETLKQNIEKEGLKVIVDKTL